MVIKKLKSYILLIYQSKKDVDMTMTGSALFD